MEHTGHHMQEVVLTRGLPASGKTTWCREILELSGSCWRYISRDDLRFMLHGNREARKWNAKREKVVSQARDRLLRGFLQDGCCVLVDETFLNPRIMQHVKGICAEFNVDVIVQDFTDISAEECIERDRYRGDRSVGAGVIREASKKLRRPAPTGQDSQGVSLTNAIIVDLDGTLALFENQSPYDRLFLNDTPNEAVVNLVRIMALYARIIITSGRKEEYRDVTLAWLATHGIPFATLLMRQASQAETKDAWLKEGWYNNAIAPHYNVLFVLDDRDQCIDMWRRLGLTALQVEYGGF